MPVLRAEIARSGEPSGVLAKRYGVSTETVRKWRKRGAGDCLDRSAKPHKLPWKATDEERAVVCALRRATDFALDDLTFVVAHFLPHLNRDSVWRILRAEGLSRRPPPSSDKPRRGQGTFKDYDLGFVHIDIKHLPKLQTANGERRKRYLFVAIDRCSRSVHLAVKDDETERSAVAFLREAAAAFPFRLTHVLTDNGSCFTPAFARACAELGAEYRHTRPSRGQGSFRDYDLGFVHIDIKHLPKLQTGNGERRKRYLYVAIDRRSRSVHLAVKDDETERSAIAFLREAAAAFPFRLTHVLTDNGSCFTPAFAT